MKFRYWEDGGHILVGECFLRNESLNPMINWLNLHKDDFECGKPLEWEDKNNEVWYLSVLGNLMINTRRDFVLLTKDQRLEFFAWLNEHREILKIREVWR